MVNSNGVGAPRDAEVRRGVSVWLTGLPSAGKTTLGRAVAQHLQSQGERVELLDGDTLRAHLGSNLGFSRADREEHLRRIAFVAGLLTGHGITVVIAAISPYRQLRSELRNGLDPFLEVFVNAPLAVCRQRDVKGLYARSASGELKGLTGVDDTYEQPLLPDVECHTDLETVAQSAAKILFAIGALRHQAGQPEYQGSDRLLVDETLSDKSGLRD